MQAMLKLMPLPEYDPRTTTGNYNYDSEEITDVPKLNNVVRVDWRPTDNDSLSFTFKDWVQDQRGTRIPAGPSNWQWFNAHYKNTDRGFTGNYTKVLRSNIVWDTDFGTPSPDGGVLSAERRGMGQDQPRRRRLRRLAVPSRAEPARRAAARQLRQHHRQHRVLAELHLRHAPVRSRRRLAHVGPVEPDLPARPSLVQGRRLCRRHPQLRGQGRRRRRVVGRRLQLRGRHQQPARHELRLRQRAARQFHLVHGDRWLRRRARPAADVRVLRPGHLEAEVEPDAGLRRALPLVSGLGVRRGHEVVVVRSRPLRAGSLAAALSAGPRQRTAAGAQPDHRRDPAGGLRGRVRAGDGRSLQRHGDRRRVGQLRDRLPGRPGHPAGVPGRPGVGHHRQRQDVDPRQHRALPQPVRQRERARQPGPQSAGAEQPGAALFDHRQHVRSRGGRRLRHAAERWRARPRARRAYAEEPELLGRHPARDRLGHRARRDLRRQPDAEHRGQQLRPQRHSVQRQLPRSQSAEHQPGHRRRAAGRFPAPVSRLRHHHPASQRRRDRLQLAAGTAQPAVHQGPPVRPRLHARQRLGHARDQPLPDRRSGSIAPRRRPRSSTT